MCSEPKSVNITLLSRGVAQKRTALDLNVRRHWGVIYMLRVRLKHWLFATSFLLAGCDLTSNTALEKKLEATNAQIASLQSDMTELKRKQDIDEFIKSMDNFAYLRPGSDGYSTIKFDLGVLTVQLADVKPYANGSKVTLKFGNTLSASINGLKATIDWGKVNEKGSPINDSEKSKEVTFKQILRSSSWTSTTVVLDDLPPNVLGFVRVHDVTHTGIQLFGK